MLCTTPKYIIAGHTSHFSDALFPRLPDLIKYNLPVPSERVTHMEDEKCIEAQRRLSHAVKSVGSLKTSLGFCRAVSYKQTAMNKTL